MDVLPPFNFLTLHYVYFLATTFICSVIFWGSATPFRSVGYADSLFMCASAITGAGLNTVCFLPSACSWLFMLINLTGQPVSLEHLSAIDTLLPHHGWIARPRF